MKTFTPELDATAIQRLAEYAAHFASDFPQAKPARWSAVYLQGLLLDGERKSIEPMARRVTLPADLPSKDPEQALQQCVNHSPWDEHKVLRRYRALLAGHFASPEGIFVIDDTSFPKQGRHSVGVQRQYGGALGKRANCQAAVSVHYVSPAGHYPLDLRLYLPDSWLSDKERLDGAGVPEDQRRPLTKPQIALELLDRVRGEGLPGRVVVTDAGYGDAAAFRAALAERGLHYLAGVKPEAVAFAAEPSWVQRPRRGRTGPAPTRWQLAPGAPPVPIGELAKGLRLRRVT
jgi:SRSO17 transposase